MYAVQLEGITKRFADLVANDAIDLEVRSGEVHCLLGENGAGKSTLMKILFGLYSADSGTVRIEGEPRRLRGPSDAIKLGLGMVHQHFMLVDRLSVTENIVAGNELTSRGVLDLSAARTQILQLAERYGLHVSPDALIEEISVGEQQRVEILKALYREAQTLILDEPTAVLTPQETEELFQVIRRLKQDGKTVILITHKLRETMAISDRVTILRDGRVVGTVEASETTPAELARMMVGREVLLRVEKPASRYGEATLEVADLTVPPRYGTGLRHVSFAVRRGEILGIAGVEGNGQLELEEAISGLRRAESGEIRLGGHEIGTLAVRRRRRLGLAHIPSDRMRRGLVPSFSVAWNTILGSQRDAPFAGRGVLRPAAIAEHARSLITEYSIRAAGASLPAAQLSGGNQQKVILAREFSRDPLVVLACQPTRGVDVGAIEYIHNRLLELRAAGKAVLLVSAELDELRALSDRILVLYEGRIVAERPGDCPEHELGLLMAGQLQVPEERRENGA